MSNISLHPLNRRGLLRLGIATGILGAAAGCDEGGTKTITTPPGANGNRARLKALQEKSDTLKPNQQPKKKP
jgi:hypothetical protein